MRVFGEKNGWVGGIWVLGLVLSICLVANAAPPDLVTRYQPREDPPSYPEVAENSFPAVCSDPGISRMGSCWVELVETPPAGVLGGPEEGLSLEQWLAFLDGRHAFKKEFTEAEGLGPYFNDRSCAACHSDPTLGGGGRDMGVGLRVHAPPGDPSDTVGLRRHAIAGRAAEEPNGHVAHRRAPPLYGIGRLDAVTNEVMLANADPDDLDQDGIRGIANDRGHNSPGVRTARFGAKAHEWNLYRFIGSALRDEMGVTNEVSRSQSADDDGIDDPEAPPEFVGRVDAFVRHLAPPPRGQITAAVLEGEALFDKTGCTGCHKPALGDLKGAYTDLLLHDLGEKNDEMLVDRRATGSHWRTVALWGLRFRTRYLHDERAGNVREVLEFHGGEAAQATRRFNELSKPEQEKLIAFLQSL